MKKIISIIVILACFGQILCPAQERLRERVYVTTDKGVYVAGDALWLSAYCLDVNTGKLSDFSKTAYVEIHSSAGLVQTGKIALLNGRGAGRIVLQNTIPTGNYSIIAYTAQSRNEIGFPYAANPRNITIFNTFSTDRQKEGVIVADEVAAGAAISATGGIEIEAGGGVGTGATVPVRLTNRGSKAASVSLSVYHNDGIPAPADAGIGAFLKDVAGAAAPQDFTEAVVPEYEGEIIRAHVSGTEDARNAAIGKFAFISVPGSQRNVYASTIQKDGSATFYTTNIYGDNDIFLEIENMPEDKICHLELKTPFVNAPVADIPELAITSDWEESLRLRSLGMQISKAFDADTLFDFLPLYDHNILSGDRIRYVLDDYTRFTLMEEVFIEFIPELRVRKVNGKREIQVRILDYFNDLFFSTENSLMLIDGVPVLDQEKVINYDPLLVQYIDIYPNTYFFGVRGFQGVVNFVTYKHTLPSLKFADNVRVVSNQGVAYPLSFRGDGLGSDYPDYRQTICWEPMLNLEPGESVVVNVKTPAYGGRFDISVEGITDDSQPVKAASSFTVR